MPSIFDKLGPVLTRYNEIEESMGRPEVATDFEQVQILAKERASLETLVDIAYRHQELVEEQEDLNSLLQDGSDAVAGDHLLYTFLSALELPDSAAAGWLSRGDVSRRHQHGTDPRQPTRAAAPSPPPRDDQYSAALQLADELVASLTKR